MSTIATPTKFSGQVWLRGLLAPVLLLVLIFPPAGTWAYWQGWLYLVLNLGVLGATLYVLRSNPQLIEERLKPGQGMKRFDLVYFWLSTPLYLVGLVLAALDAGRFGWSPTLPWWVYLVSVVLFLIGQGVFLWAKKANSFFSSVVRIQTERGHTVCRGGPYGYVRHPGYAGSFVWTLAAPLLLGSLWALIPAVLSVLLLIWRTGREDAVLQKELPGYAEYARDVKYRLLPGVW